MRNGAWAVWKPNLSLPLSPEGRHVLLLSSEMYMPKENNDVDNLVWDKEAEKEHRRRSLLKPHTRAP